MYHKGRYHGKQGRRQWTRSRMKFGKAVKNNARSLNRQMKGF